jgi:chemotaxis protein CheD
MFVDTGIVVLFRAIYALKAEKHRVQICVAGGAQFMDKTGFFNIGQRNFASLIQLLNQHGLSVEAKDVGGLVSRTVNLHLRSGEVRLKSSGQSEEIVLFKGYANAG